MESPAPAFPPSGSPATARVSPVRTAALADDGEAEALRAGLLRAPARLPPRYFYDAQGNALYAAICHLEEYYPVRLESAITAARRDAIVGRLPARIQWIELGCGDGAKSRPWLEAADVARFIGVDSSEDALQALAHLPRDGGRTVAGVALDLATAWSLHAWLEGGPPPVFFYPGSSIGNFEPAEALLLLRTVRAHCADHGSLLVGVDLVKDPLVLRAAYDDALGVTAAFNRNVLRVVNRLLGADFDPGRFRHRAAWEAFHQRVEMHLVAERAHTVRLGATVERFFDEGESILTECSYKYRPGQFEALLRRAGFGKVESWTDPGCGYALFLARP